MKTANSLLEGNITKSILKLAFPLMGMSFLQMAYNLTDIFWIGKLGAGAVAGVGLGGTLVWFSSGIHMLSQIGGQVLVGQNLGAGEYKNAGKYAHASIFLSICISIFLGIIFTIFIDPIVGFFKLNELEVVNYAKTYIVVTCGLIFFQLMTKLLTTLITTTGNSKIPLLASSIGLIFNIIIDPILIFGLLGFPKLGVLGAGIATVLAQIIVLSVLIFYIRKDTILFCHVKLLKKPDFNACVKILKLSYPVSLQNTIFPLITMYLSRLVAGFSDEAVASQRIGAQIESISWMATEGFAIAVNSFISQNYGARNLDRATKGYFSSAKILSVYSIVTSLILIIFAKPLFSIFLSDPIALDIGTDYLVIMGYSQFFMCMELLSSSSLNAFGKTFIPASISLIFTALRAPLAKYLSTTALGISGIWYTITATTILKGIFIFLASIIFIRQIKATPRN